MEIETVLDEYRKGDESRRLGLFMAYRDLRSQFERIEEEDGHDDFVLFPFRRRRKGQAARAA